MAQASPDAFEVIIVDDASDDGTMDLVAQFDLPPTWVVVPLRHHAGRSRARNIGASTARGDLLAFLDGDALPGPGWLLAYREHLSDAPGVACGRQFCLPRLEFVDDPEMGRPIHGDIPSIVMRAMESFPDEFRITRRMVETGFDAVEAKSELGGYPRPEAVKIQSEAESLISVDPFAKVRWLGLYPHNFATTRDLFTEVGGFDEDLPFSEGWELGYRLAAAGAPFLHAERARSFHLYHYHDFTTKAGTDESRTLRMGALEQMAKKTGEQAFVLVESWLRTLAEDPLLPDELRICSVDELEELWGALDTEAETSFRRVADFAKADTI